MSELNKLSLLQAENPKLYPPYLNELLGNNYLNLYHHLMTMKTLETHNEVSLEIKKIPSTQSKLIISEAKEAIINKVKSIITTNYLDIYFILGASGCGKSTALCFLRGDKLKLKYFDYSDKNKLIGNSLYKSRTFLPEFGKVGNRLFIEFPGFYETNGKLICEGIDLALKELIQIYDPKFIILDSINNLYDKYRLILKLNFLSVDQKKCILGITKYSRNVYFWQIKDAKETYDKDLKYLEERELDLIEDIKFFKEFLKEEQKKHKDNFKEISEKLDEHILIKEKELLEIAKERESYPLKFSETITNNEKLIKEQEKSLVKLIEMPNFIRFKDLEYNESRELSLREIDAFSVGIWKNDMIKMINKVLDNSKWN